MLNVADRLKARLTAATINRRQYLTLRNTVRIVRGSGVTLSECHKSKLEMFEETVREYDRLENAQSPEANA